MAKAAHHASRRTYVCFGTAWNVEREFAELVEAGGAYPWKIPQAARPGDLIIIYRHGPGFQRFEGEGRLLATPRRDQEGNMLGRIGKLRNFPNPVSLSIARNQFPNPFLKGFRSTLEVPPSIADDFIAFLRGDVASGDVDQEFFEGERRLRQHVYRERNRALIQKKRDEVLAATRELRCEACRFSFEEMYGKLGSGFCEVHHLVPLSELTSRRSIKTIELAVVCSNCHRMIHKSRPMLTIQELRKLVGGEA
jgi:hypothetical protein